jgi:predicted ArsR family transcriptional regulator
MSVSTTDLRVLRLLKRGPVYRPAIEMILGLSEREARGSVTRLDRRALIEINAEIGPATWQLTDKGRALLEGRSEQ